MCKKKKTTPSHSSQKQTSWLARRTHQYKNRIHLHRNTHKHKHTVNSNLMINHAPNQTGFILNSAFMRFTFAVSPKKIQLLIISSLFSRFGHFWQLCTTLAIFIFGGRVYFYYYYYHVHFIYIADRQFNIFYRIIYQCHIYSFSTEFTDLLFEAFYLT